MNRRGLRSVLGMVMGWFRCHRRTILAAFSPVAKHQFGGAGRLEHDRKQRAFTSPRAGRLELSC